MPRIISSSIIRRFSLLIPSLLGASFILLAFLLAQCTTNPSDPVKTAFENPPDSARPGVYWYFMDGNLNREAMTADLESMKEAGIGYVLFLEVNVGVPRGKVDMLSDQWKELFVHAVNECKRLGIRLIMGSGPGWAGSGGPWVKPEQSMMHLVASETRLTGPSTFKGVLPKPQPVTPYFGEGSLPVWMREQRAEWYQDVLLLAYPTPTTTDTLGDILEKALYYRGPYTSQPGIKPFLPAPSSYPEITGRAIDPDSVIDVTRFLNTDGSIKWEVPKGNWTLLRLGTRNNGAVTRPAPRPGLGFEADKFNARAFTDHFNHYLQPLIDKLEGGLYNNQGGWTMIHIDSWEMGAQNWTGSFRREFMERRGYDPLPYLPAYSGAIVGSRELSERFLWDVRITSNELIIENHAEHFKSLGDTYGLRLSIEPYDMNPATDLDLGAVADVPMCEFWSDGFGFNSSFSTIESTSIAHIIGAPVVAAEAFTAMSNEAWKLYPTTMKNQSDWAFAMGINRFVYHTFAHKPLPDSLRPGMTMGPYGVHWDRGQTWWSMASDYHRYVTRCQYLLSQGRTIADILYLTPAGAPHVFRPPLSAMDGTEVLPDKLAYNFDGCSPLQLIKWATVKKGKIVFPGGASYELMVLPNVETMTPELLQKIAALAKEGARIMGSLPPAKSPSLVNYPYCDEKVQKLGEALWSDNLITRARYGTDLYPDYATTTMSLEQAGVKPDFTCGGSFRYTHRTLTNREVYFVSNRTNEKVTEKCTFRDATPAAEWWDPVTGETRPLTLPEAREMGTSLSITLEPSQSGFVVFYTNKKLAKKVVPTGPNFPEVSTVQTLEGPWQVSFDPKWGGPAKVIFDTLSDWTQNTDLGIRYYSGTARYTLNFNLKTPPDNDKTSQLFLDLGTVKDMARVKLNGQDLGIVWTNPWQVDITDVVKPKENQLEIEVANRWINRLIGDEDHPEQKYTYTTHHFYKAGDQLVESGLLGKVTVRMKNDK